MSDTKKPKHRSPNFPVAGLREAIERAQRLFDSDGMAGSTKDSVYTNMGYKSKNGASMGMLSALMKYGLTEEKNGRIVPTRDAALILVKGGSEEQKREAIRRCALKPQLYNELWSEYAEAKALPGDDTLRSMLVSERGFNPNSVNQVIQGFRETIAFAGLTYDNSSDYTPNAFVEAGKNAQKIFDMFDPTKTDDSPKSEREVRDYAIPRKGQKVAILRLEYPVSADDVEQIEKWLELMKGTISED